MQTGQGSGGWDDIARVSVIGARGMLGSTLVEVLAGKAEMVGAPGVQVDAADIDEVDITRQSSVEAYLADRRPDLVMNCAAYTDVDGCEKETELAMAVNGVGPGHLAQVCVKQGSRLVHVSTDFVFDGCSPRAYRPDDEPSPLSVYGLSKLTGERAVQAGGDEHLIVRTSWLFGRSGKHFVSTIRRLAAERDHLDVVDDQVGSPTYADDLACAMVWLVEARARGVYHFRNEGHCSWYDFAQAIVAEFGLRADIRPIKSEQLARPAIRPPWSVLDIARYKQSTGQSVRSWQAALAAYAANV